ncbi:MAG TPA: hypothetical protein VLL05_16700 [Terriglobales bacterium]|nr:hypothetical protein [Terriglobales bacterium]
MWKKREVADVKSVDNNSQNRGVAIACEDGSVVTLIFDRTIARQRTGELMQLLEEMKLTLVIVETP